MIEQDSTRRVQDEQLAAVIAKAWLALPPAVRDSGWPEWSSSEQSTLEVLRV